MDLTYLKPSYKNVKQKHLCIIILKIVYALIKKNALKRELINNKM